LSNPAQAKASKNYICSCGCGEKILCGQQVVVHMGDFYSPGHYFPQPEYDPPPTIHKTIQTEPEQLELQLF